MHSFWSRLHSQCLAGRAEWSDDVIDGLSTTREVSQQSPLALARSVIMYAAINLIVRGLIYCVTAGLVVHRESPNRSPLCIITHERVQCVPLCAQYVCVRRPLQMMFVRASYQVIYPRNGCPRWNRNNKPRYCCLIQFFSFIVCAFSCMKLDNGFYWLNSCVWDNNYMYIEYCKNWVLR